MTTWSDNMHLSAAIYHVVLYSYTSVVIICLVVGCGVKDIDKVLKLLDVLNTSIYVSVLVNDSISYGLISG